MYVIALSLMASCWLMYQGPVIICPCTCTITMNLSLSQKDLFYKSSVCAFQPVTHLISYACLASFPPPVFDCLQYAKTDGLGERITCKTSGRRELYCRCFSNVTVSSFLTRYYKKRLKICRRPPHVYPALGLIHK